MSDLRDHSQPCVHGWLIYHDHADAAVDCPGGREVTIDQSFVEFVIRDEVPTWPQWKVEHVARRVIAATIGDTG